MTHIMTSTRRLRRVESENQIWMVIPNHCIHKNGLENEMLINLHLFYIFLGLAGELFGRFQV